MPWRWTGAVPVFRHRRRSGSHGRLFAFFGRRCASTFRSARPRSETGADGSKKPGRSDQQGQKRLYCWMSHEIGIPLNSIIGYSELLFDSPPYSGTTAIRRTIDFAGAALLTIERCWIFQEFKRAGLRSCRSRLRFMPSSTNGFYHSGPGAATGPRTVSVRRSRFSKALIGDESRIRQICNLLNNAVKFTGEGKVSLLVKGRRSGGALRVRFVISDTGVGMRTRIASGCSSASRRWASRHRRTGGTGASA